MQKSTNMMSVTGLHSKIIWLAFLAIFLGGCHSMITSVGPASQHILIEGSSQQLAYPTDLWTLSLEYRFEAETSSASTGSLQIGSTLTVHNPGVKAVRMEMHFVDANNRVLDSETLLNISPLSGSPIVTNHQFSTPAGTVAIAFTGGTRGRQPLDD